MALDPSQFNLSAAPLPALPHHPSISFSAYRGGTAIFCEGPYVFHVCVSRLEIWNQAIPNHDDNPVLKALLEPLASRGFPVREPFAVSSSLKHGTFKLRYWNGGTYVGWRFVFCLGCGFAGTRNSRPMSGRENLPRR
jgi:hypothetical protein